MTAEELREIDARIAVEIMGWHWMKKRNGMIAIFPPADAGWTLWNYREEDWEPADSGGDPSERFSDWYRVCSLHDDASSPHRVALKEGLPRFSTDHNEFAEVLAEIGRRGDRYEMKYGERLCIEAVQIDWVDEYVFRFETAPLPVKCAAALKAIEETGK